MMLILLFAEYLYMYSSNIELLKLFGGICDVCSVIPFQITPVLSGICQMQGPLDEADCDFKPIW